ncbi:MAG: hypothetical protein KAR11_00900 [Phycisphaerae bacterium]|nr:hypothetical protein [Phycisphaerae bacterium]
MKSSRNVTCFSFVLLFSFLLAASPAMAQFGPYSRALKRAKKVTKGADDRNRELDDVINKEGATKPKKKARRKKKKKPAPAVAVKPLGEVIFSTAPINPLDPRDITKTFKAGDNIYGVLQLRKKLQLLSSDSSWYAQLNVTVFVDGKPRPDGSFWIREKLSPNKHMLLNVAPKPDNLISYENYDVTYQPLPNSWGTCGGPLQLTNLLATLPAGKHTVKIVVRHGKQQAVGEFTIDGDFKPYAKLYKQLLAQSITRMKLPKPGMVDKEIEKDMITTAGHGREFKGCEILQAVIISPKWTVTKVNLGKDGSVHFRSLRAALAIKDSKGKYWIARQVLFTEDYDDDEDDGYDEMELFNAGYRMQTLKKNVVPVEEKSADAESKPAELDVKKLKDAKLEKPAVPKIP